MNLDQFLDLAETRRSVRAYKPDPVPDDLLRRVLEAVRLAPSACNRQPSRWIVLRDPAARRSLGTAYARDWFWTAPVCIALCVDLSAAWTRPYDSRSYAFVDGAIAMDHLTLAAAAAGLGTCWIAAFDPAAARAALSLPDNWDVVALTPLGYPAPEPNPRPRSRNPLADSLYLDRTP